MIINVGTPGNYKRLDADPAPAVQIVEEVRTMPRSTKLILAAAAGTLILDAFVTYGSVTAMAAPASVAPAFAPVKKLLLDLADPLCYVMFVWGCIECIVGRPASGLNRMKYAAIGYLAINWIPVLMEIIRQARPGGA